MLISLEQTAASDLGEHYFEHSCVEVEVSKLLPVKMEEEEHKVRTVAFQITPSHVDRIITMLSPEDQSLEEQASVEQVIMKDSIILKSIPELGHTEGMSLFLKEYLGDQFKISKTSKLLYFPFCPHSSSQADTTFYHTVKNLFSELV